MTLYTGDMGTPCVRIDVALLAGWGGASYTGTTAMAQHGRHYGAQPRRLLVFSLDGKARPPPTRPLEKDLVIVDNSDQKIDTAQARAGQGLYLAKCVACHGFAVISGGAAPDLRASNAAAELQSFMTIVQSGALQSRGMPMFDDINDREVEQIYWFVRQRARETLSGAPLK